MSADKIKKHFFYQLQNNIKPRLIGNDQAAVLFWNVICHELQGRGPIKQRAAIGNPLLV